MAYAQDSYYSEKLTAANAVPSERAAFIQKTYLHLAGAIAVFAGLQALLLLSGAADPILKVVYGNGNLGMLLLMVAFIGGGYLARWWANASPSKAMQYLGLGLYVVLEALIILPLLYYVQQRLQAPGLIAKAGILTGGLFIGLTVAVFTTKADFSWLRTALVVVSFVAFFVILAGMFFGGFTLGLWFSAAMIVLASGWIVYDTSNVLHHYPTDHYVGAALELFASVALLFFYILRFLMQQNRD